jgi:galactose mutarotase-like enzyme
MQTSVDERELDGRAALALRTGDLEAVVVPGGGMAVAALRLGDRDLLGTRGVALLHPAASGPPGLDPFWEVGHATADPTGAEVMATLDVADPALLAAFPYPHALALTHRVDAGGLETTLTLMPTGDVPVPIAFGFHPCLAPGGDRRLWEIDLPSTGRVESAQPGSHLLGDAAYDDLLPALEPDPVFAVRAPGIALEVAFGPGYPCARVYAPVDADVICFEPMTAPADALAHGDGLRHAAPGDAFTAAFRIDVVTS